jgi:transcriptional regulator with XRE-family HTH domain
MLTEDEVGRLKRVRLEKDQTYRELADAIGVSYSSLFRILHQGSRRVVDRTAYKLRRYLAGVS